MVTGPYEPNSAGSQQQNDPCSVAGSIGLMMVRFQTIMFALSQTCLLNAKSIEEAVELIAKCIDANDIARVTTEYELRANFSAVNELFIENSDVRMLFNTSLSDPNHIFSDEETYLFTSMAYRVLNVWVAMEMAYDEGMIGRESFGETLADIRAWVQDKPAGHEVWSQIIEAGTISETREIALTIKRYLGGI